MAGAAGTFISLVIVGAIIGAYGSSLADNKVDGWVAVAFIYIYDVNFSYSFAPIGWVLPSEIFNLTIRSKAISITTSTTWMCNFILSHRLRVHTLEDMDLVFGDTAAHEEKERLRQIEVQLCGVRVNGNDLEKGPSEAVFNNDEEV
ncbi:putative Sugar transport protein 1 [Glarea lozoyensis 74030]|uniref:Putative Sugar transport protein 1 n=1 Tax=Glarea lozoyensis (strain ATCC 74030 / MF5533) TaxID=1104152 RepID=H0EJI9_GLAL7|nr:putative Sugar transport protein 1 [Glarea lozoyensis 74030]